LRNLVNVLTYLGKGCQSQRGLAMTPQYAYHFLLVEQDFIDKFEATPDVARSWVTISWNCRT
jgi:hypothetical protein